MTSISGGVAVVTGGASGIGRGIAEQLIAEGATVVIADVEEEPLRRAAAEMGASGLRTDVRIPTDVQRLADMVLEQHGRVDIVVNNAGVGPIARIHELTLDDWKWMIEVNLFGVIHGIHTFLPILESNAAGGHIVNTSSMGSLAPVIGTGAYTATKCAITGLTEVLDLELRDQQSRVGATVILPGTVHTNIASSQRNRNGGANGGLHDVDIAEDEATAGLRWMQPIEVGLVVCDAIRKNSLYAVTHPEWWHLVEARQASVRGAFTDATSVLGA